MRNDKGFSSRLSSRFLSRFKEFLQLGLTPEAIALGVAVGIVAGVFPVFGLTTLLGAAFALGLKLNMPLVLTVNYLMTPFHILMILPWIRMGTWIFGWPGGRLTPADLLRHFTEDGWNVVIVLWEITLRAVGAWCLAAPPITAVLYLVLKPLFVKWAAEAAE